MRKWIIFKATGDELGWEERLFAQTNSFTNILGEHFDSSEEPLPEIGYRPPEFIRVEQSVDPKFPAAKTHYREGDWEVVAIETYDHEIGSPYAQFDTIAICYCQYNPIASPLKILPKPKVSIDSFGGDKEAYEQWLESQIS